jgi:hypothetical protein
MMRRIKMLWSLARRGAWYGFGRFSGAWLWGMTHTHCRQCGGPKKRECAPNCYRCQYKNLMRALEEEQP